MLPIAGRPMIAHSIDAALRAASVTRVVVSTDDPEIAAAARAAGAEIPFIRPAELATDDVPQGAACLHAIDTLAACAAPQAEFVVVQANSPLVSPEDIDAAIALFTERQASAVLTLVPLDKPIEAAFRLGDDARLRNVLREDYDRDPVAAPRQRYGPRYLICGSVVVVRTELFRPDFNYFYSNPDAYGVVVPPERAVDIDSRLDYDFACFLTERACQ